MFDLLHKDDNEIVDSIHKENDYMFNLLLHKWQRRQLNVWLTPQRWPLNVYLPHEDDN